MPYCGKFVDFRVGKARLDCVADIENALRRRADKPLADFVVVCNFVAAEFATAAETARADFHRAQGLLQGFLESSADCHRLAHALHRRREGVVAAREFFESEAGNFRYDIVNRRLEACGSFARDVVAKLVERVADGEFRRDFRNRKSRRLRRQSRTARDARVHFDDNHAPVFGVHRKLDIRTARLDADFADYRKACVAHELVFLVGEGERGGYGD